MTNLLTGLGVLLAVGAVWLCAKAIWAVLLIIDERNQARRDADRSALDLWRFERRNHLPRLPIHGRDYE